MRERIVIGTLGVALAIGVIAANSSSTYATPQVPPPTPVATATSAVSPLPSPAPTATAT